MINANIFNDKIADVIANRKSAIYNHSDNTRIEVRDHLEGLADVEKLVRKLSNKAASKRLTTGYINGVNEAFNIINDIA